MLPVAKDRNVCNLKTSGHFFPSLLPSVPPKEPAQTQNMVDSLFENSLDIFLLVFYELKHLVYGKDASFFIFGCF